MKRKTKLFIDKSKDSLLLAIELFNRPSDSCRTEGVIILLDHSFEMLLKATVLEKTGGIREKQAKYNYGFDKCLNVCETRLNLIDKDASLILRNLNGLRDVAQHDVVIISERLLYAHAQSSVAIFNSLLSKIFSINLVNYMPNRVLPVSTLPPVEMQVLINEDMGIAKSLLAGSQRRRIEAEARVRTYMVIEKNLRDLYGDSSHLPSVERLVTQIKRRNWQEFMPMVAGLVQTSPDGIPISLSVSKEGYPICVDPSSPTAIAFKYVKPEDMWPFLTDGLASKLGIGRHYFLELVKMFELKHKDEYHIAIKSGESSSVQKYSGKAYQVLRTAIDREGLDKLWKAAKRGEKMRPDDYL